LATALREHDGNDLEQRLNAAKVRDLRQETQESLANGGLGSWHTEGASPVQPPGLGFRVEKLFAGQSQLLVQHATA
jgi:hypothetical protein